MGHQRRRLLPAARTATTQRKHATARTMTSSQKAASTKSASRKIIAKGMKQIPQNVRSPYLRSEYMVSQRHAHAHAHAPPHTHTRAHGKKRRKKIRQRTWHEEVRTRRSCRRSARRREPRVLGRSRDGSNCRTLRNTRHVHDTPNIVQAMNIGVGSIK